jgi:hypothetical protein
VAVRLADAPRLITDHQTFYVGRRKVVLCIVDGKRQFLEEPLEEPGFTTRARTQVGEPDRVRAGLLSVTP